jgi:hypothetical protein
MIKKDKDYSVPITINYKSFLLEILHPKHNELDYKAWSSCKDNLQGIFGPKNDWPNNVQSIEQNLKDLENHYQEFIDQVAYTYTIMKQDRSQCVGCLYIRPVNSTEFSTRVDFWWINEFSHLDKDFQNWVENWLKREWGIEKVCFPGRTLSWSDFYRLS